MTIIGFVEPRKTTVYESRLTHEGWAVICDGRVLQLFHIQRQADNAALELGEKSVGKGNPTEVRLLKSNGQPRRTKAFVRPKVRSQPRV